MKHGIQRWAALCALFLVTACGGGGGSTTDVVAGPGPGPGPAPATGTVGIMFTDSPTHDFDQVIATVARIELLGGNGPATIFSGPPQEVDFLRLESFSEVFAIAENVPAGDYSKIRLILDDLRVIKLDDQGNIVEESSVRLPGNGKVDLNPRGTFFVMPGSTMLVEIDVDAKKSLNVNLTGNGTKYEFRPVVFVKISDHIVEGGRLARIFGTVDSVNSDENNFVLCQDGRHSDPDHDSDSDSDGSCLTVQVLEDTGIFDSNGDSVPDLSMLMAGDPLTAIGNLRVSDEATDSDGDSDGNSDSDTDSDSDSDSDMDADGDSDGESDSDVDSDSDSESDNDDHGDSDSDSDAAFDDDDLILDAVVVELGAMGTFERLKGEITADYDDATSQFELTIASGQGFADGTTVNGLVQMGTRIFDKEANLLDTTALMSGRSGHFDGVLMPSNSEPDTLKTSLIVLNTEPVDDGSISGEIVSVAPDDRALLLLVDTMERCVHVAAGAEITVVTITDTGTDTGPAMLSDLMPGWPAIAFGAEAANGCFAANSIRAENDQRTVLNTAPVADAGADQAITTGESVILDGSGSSDADGDMLTYGWTLQVPAGSAVVLVAPETVNPAFTTDVDGDYVAELIVNDGKENSAPDSVTISATASGNTPTPLNGVVLYAEFCASCHGALAESEVRNTSAAATQAAIDAGTGGMDTPALMALTTEELQAIAVALSQ